MKSRRTADVVASLRLNQTRNLRNIKPNFFSSLISALREPC
jgi:hypothetical protein